MALIKDGKLAVDAYVDVSSADIVPPTGSVIVGLAQWQAHTAELGGRREPIGLRLRSDESPVLVADDLERFAVIALEFPAFRDGRAYSYARILRERYGFAGELRAVGDVLMEQLHFMLRVGFDAFELGGDDPVAAYETALKDFSVWYQPTGDGRGTAMQLRRRS
jgi:uncharacterized protein (DUF934 family)